MCIRLVGGGGGAGGTDAQNHTRAGKKGFGSRDQVGKRGRPGGLVVSTVRCSRRRATNGRQQRRKNFVKETTALSGVDARPRE